jgi:hypothetical protein
MLGPALPFPDGRDRVPVSDSRKIARQLVKQFVSPPFIAAGHQRVHVIRTGNPH